MQTYSTKPASILTDVITDVLAEGWAVPCVRWIGQRIHQQTKKQPPKGAG